MRGWRRRLSVFRATKRTRDTPLNTPDYSARRYFDYRIPIPSPPDLAYGRFLPITKSLVGRVPFSTTLKFGPYSTEETISL